MKVKERQYFDGGLGGGAWYVRVVEIDDDKKAPAGAEVVPDKTPVHDWTPEGN